ncbi:MAG: 6-carboxytetrahydropterin synthase QueD [Eggerthellaceae bacterium]|jgi:queuosine biosynthesis protein QueD|nr:6-carboxytetrahydropterin synthase QueD [Eggerthellaceae bacterium]
MIKASLKTDGGSRGNPGIAGIGFELVKDDGEVLAQGGWYIPHATNNVAEYSALIWGLENARAAKVTHLQAFADSELIVKQIEGSYKVKSADLKPLFLRAKSLLEHFEEVTIQHIYRAENEVADKFANKAMDICGFVGYHLVPWDGSQVNLFDELCSDATEPCLTGRLEGDSGVEQVGTAQGKTTVRGRESIMERNHAYTGTGKLTGSTYENVGGNYELMVKEHFDAAHTLPGYDGPCRYLHGHTWDVEVTIGGHDLDEVGILVDFQAVKESLWAILQNFDHRYINDTPPFDVINPTAENLARVIFYELEECMPAGAVLKVVSVWESPHAKVSYRP